ncbi:MAG: hypothetical protein KKF68_00430 [Nanoarchaeota archaeon]|nr:hypothetical protein [Nanoarchaeota archaeon]
MVKDKKGWIRIVEAFVAILLITGVILILLNKQEISERDISLKVYQTEIAILREIELDDNLRADILGVDKSLLPVDWEDEEFPLTIKEKISERAPNYMKCIGKICEVTADCLMEEGTEKEIYAQSVAIMATLESFNPRQLKIFCWMND